MRLRAVCPPFLSILLLLISIFPSHVYLDCVHAYCPSTWEEGTGSPETGVIDDLEPLCRCWDPKWGPLREKQALLAAEPSLEPCYVITHIYLFFGQFYTYLQCSSLSCAHQAVCFLLPPLVFLHFLLTPQLTPFHFYSWFFPTFLIACCMWLLLFLWLYWANRHTNLCKIPVFLFVGPQEQTASWS